MVGERNIAAENLLQGLKKSCYLVILLGYMVYVLGEVSIGSAISNKSQQL